MYNNSVSQAGSSLCPPSISVIFSMNNGGSTKEMFL
jgi:hypothetical protein